MAEDTVNTPECLANLLNASLCLQNGQCFSRNSTYSTCLCTPGRIGPNCELLRKPIVGNYIFDGIFYAAVFALLTFLAVRRYRQTNGADFDAARLKGVLSSRPNVYGLRTMFVYRFLCFGFIFGVHIANLTVSAPGTYRFYTVWNFIVLITYFGLGLGLAGFALIKGTDAIVQSKYMKFNAALHWLLLEIELPNTLIVDVVTWGVLLPSCGAPCPGLVNFSSFVQHLVNFFLISGDFALCRHAFDRHHFHFNLIMPTLYAIFHLILTLVTDVNGHNPMYFFLDASSALQPAWIIGVLILHVAIFFLVYAFSTFVLGRRADNVYSDSEGSDKKSLMQSANPSYQDA